MLDKVGNYKPTVHLANAISFIHSSSQVFQETTASL